MPIGCVIVYEGRIIGRGYNRRTIDGNVLAHAEILAIRKACRFMGDWRLEGCTMYVTLEPCPMCAGAIVQARIPKVVIGCMNPKAGCAGSVLDLLHEKGFNHQVETEIGICGEECSRMLKDFFKELRAEEKRRKEEKRDTREPEGQNDSFSRSGGSSAFWQRRRWTLARKRRRRWLLSAAPTALRRSLSEAMTALRSTLFLKRTQINNTAAGDSGSGG